MSASSAVGSSGSSPAASTCACPPAELLLRPGGTVCGPALMALADITLYGVVLSLIGRVELAVTTDLNIHFLAKPRPGDLVARGRILRLGRVLAVGEVTIVGAASRPAGGARDRHLRHPACACVDSGAANRLDLRATSEGSHLRGGILLSAESTPGSSARRVAGRPIGQSSG